MSEISSSLYRTCLLMRSGSNISKWSGWSVGRGDLWLMIKEAAAVRMPLCNLCTWNGRLLSANVFIKCLRSEFLIKLTLK
jgi:hypothetical protein